MKTKYLFWMVILLAGWHMVPASAQQQTDSLYATGVRVYVQDTATANIIDATVELNSLSMGMSFIAKQYTALTNNHGFASFPKVLVGFDTTVNVPGWQTPQTLVYAQGSALIVEHPHAIQGSVELYSIDGKKHKGIYTTTHRFALGLDELSTGVYFLHAKLGDEEILRGKVFVESGQAKGFGAALPSHSAPLQHHPASAKVLSPFSADYQIIVHKEGFFPDTSVVTLEQGLSNPFIHRTLQSIPPPTASLRYTIRNMERDPLD